MSDGWTGYRLRPEDVWFFRDSKPSILGADHYLRSLFPPFPSTLYGLVRTQRLLEEGIELGDVSESWWRALSEPLRNELGEWGKDGAIELRGPWLECDGDILLPAPADLRLFLRERGDGADEAVDVIEEVVRLCPEEASRSRRNWSHGLAPMSPFARNGNGWKPWETPRGRKDPGPSDGWFLTLPGIARWISGDIPSAEHFVHGSRLWHEEPRTGVGLQAKSRQHSEGLLFTFGFIRLERGVTVGFELCGAEPLKAGRVARFGGESRLAHIEKGRSLTGELEGVAAPLSAEAGSGCVVALVTPGIFPDSDLPSAQVTAAVVRGPVLIGGWDLATRGPKPLLRAAPAGSVYWIDGTLAPLSKLPSLKTQQGFGLAIAGRQPRRVHG